MLHHQLPPFSLSVILSLSLSLHVTNLAPSLSSPRSVIVLLCLVKLEVI